MTNPTPEKPKKESDFNLQNSQFGGGLVNANIVNANRIGGDILNVNLILGEVKVISNRTSFLGLISWIHEKAVFLEKMHPRHEIEVQKIIEKASNQGYDFTRTEITVTKLVFDYCRYYRRNRTSRFKEYYKFKKKDYFGFIKEIISLGCRIRSREISLSKIIGDPELAILVKKLESFNND